MGNDSLSVETKAYHFTSCAGARPELRNTHLSVTASAATMKWVLSNHTEGLFSSSQLFLLCSACYRAILAESIAASATL